jgi:hypothetical protein
MAVAVSLSGVPLINHYVFDNLCEQNKQFFGCGSQINKPKPWLLLLSGGLYYKTFLLPGKGMLTGGVEGSVQLTSSLGWLVL